MGGKNLWEGEEEEEGEGNNQWPKNPGTRGTRLRPLTDTADMTRRSSVVKKVFPLNKTSEASLSLSLCQRLASLRLTRRALTTDSLSRV